MTINIKNRIISLMLAMLMLLSTTGFSIDLHYCQGQIKSFSLIGKARSCHDQVANNHCQHKKKSCHAASNNQDEVEQSQKKCCSNKTIQIDGNDEVKKLSTVEIIPTQIQFITAFVQVYLLEYSSLNKVIIPHLNYIPPLLNKDIPVLVQSFLL